MQEYKTTLTAKEEIAEGTFQFTFKQDGSFEFIAGQYVVLEVLNPQFTDGRPPFRSLSIASAPCEGDLSFIMRSSESAFKKSICAMEIGDEALLKGPLGHMQLPEDRSIPVVFLVAGVGITPARAMLKDAEHRDSERDFTMIYSNRSLALSACYDEMKNLDLKNYAYCPTMTSSCHGWEGTCRQVDAEFLREKIGDVLAPQYYIVGTKGFIEGMKSALAELGVREDQLVIDNFG